MKRVGLKNYVDETEKGSEAEESTFCGACLRGQVTKKAEIYCCECSEMLCDNCKLHHGRNKYTSAHNICLIKTFNDTLKLKYLAAIEKCDKHPKEKVKYLCTDHNQVCCNDCAIVEHRRCATLVSIESRIELCRLEFNVPAINLKRMDENAQQLLQHERNQYTVVSDAEKEVKEKLRSLKKNIEEEILRMETVLIKAACDQSKLIHNQISKNVTAIEHFREELKESELKLTAGKEFGQDQHKFLIHRQMQTQNKQHATDLQQLNKNSTMEAINLTGVDRFCRDFKLNLGRYLKVEKRKTSILKSANPDFLELDTLEVARTASGLESPYPKVLEVEHRRKDFETSRKELQTRAGRRGPWTVQTSHR